MTRPYQFYTSTSGPSPGQALAVSPYAQDLIKRIDDARSQGQPYHLNPTMQTFGAYQGIKDINGAMATTFRILRQIPSRNPVVAAAHNRRANMATAYAKRPRFKGDLGFRVIMRNRRQRLTPVAKAKITEIEDLLLRGGYRRPNPRTGQVAVWNHEMTQKAAGFRTAIHKMVRDSLTLDAAAIHFEIGMNEKKHPIVYWDPVDAALIRFAQPANIGADSVEGRGYLTPYRPEIRHNIEAEYVMLSDQSNTVVREYAWNEMAYLVRNPRTNELVQGYGFSELEQLIDMIKGILYGVAFNTEYFDSNHIPPGILSIVGNYTDDALKAFRRELQMMVGGMQQFHNIPILKGANAEAQPSYIPIRQTSDGAGMFWKEWILFCSVIVCAVYGMDPSEINMVNFGSSQNSLANQNPEAKLIYSAESGFEPFLASIGSMLDESIVERIDPDFEFAWEGLSVTDNDEVRAEREDRMGCGMSTPNQERARVDEPPIYDPLDRALWDHLQEQVRDHLGEEADDDEVANMTAKAYKAGGGQLATWPDAPTGSPAAIEIWMSEHGVQAPAGEGGGADGEDPENGEQEEAPPTYGPEGDDTHVGDLGAAMLRQQNSSKAAALADQRKQLEQKQEKKPLPKLHTLLPGARSKKAAAPLAKTQEADRVITVVIRRA